MSIIRNETIIINPTPEELATEFATWEAGQQAAFLNAVATADADWQFSWPFQLEFITTHPDLTPEARAWMRQLGEYADPCVRT